MIRETPSWVISWGPQIFITCMWLVALGLVLILGYLALEKAKQVCARQRQKCSELPMKKVVLTDDQQQAFKQIHEEEHANTTMTINAGAGKTPKGAAKQKHNAWRILCGTTMFRQSFEALPAAKARKLKALLEENPTMNYREIAAAITAVNLEVEAELNTSKSVLARITNNPEWMDTMERIREMSNSDYLAARKFFNKADPSMTDDEIEEHLNRFEEETESEYLDFMIEEDEDEIEEPVPQTKNRKRKQVSSSRNNTRRSSDHRMSDSPPVTFYNSPSDTYHSPSSSYDSPSSCSSSDSGSCDSSF